MPQLHRQAANCMRPAKAAHSAVCACVLPQLLPLAGAVNLRLLDVSCNQISNLAPLSGLTALTQLCCESNSITSLAGLSSLDSLMELYAAHNSLADVKVRHSPAPPLVTCTLSVRACREP